MRVSIIGAGNVGSHIAKKLHELNHDVVQVWSRSLEAAELVANEVSAEAIDEFASVDGGVALIIIAVPDDHIATVSERLNDVSALVAHTSGSVPSTVLSKHKRHGVFYPMQTFKKAGDVQWKSLPVFLFANSDNDISFLQSLGEETGSAVSVLDDQQRAALHVAAVFANNYTNHMLVIAEKLMRENNLDFNLLKPLIERTFDNDALPSAAQTGPAQRGDEQTLERQLDFLQNAKRYQAIYAMMASSIMEEKNQNE